MFRTMTITNAKYYKYLDLDKNAGITATINGTVWQVPIDEENTHYAEIKRQVDAGELTIEDAD